MRVVGPDEKGSGPEGFFDRTLRTLSRTRYQDPGPDPFAALYPMGGEHSRWTYHDSGELNTSIRYEGTDPEEMSPTEVTPNQDYSLTYDLIGNRDDYLDDGGRS